VDLVERYTREQGLFRLDGVDPVYDSVVELDLGTIEPSMAGPAAQKPGDVIRYLNGTTVEVLNTDAEGRLVLADGLVLASRDKPDAIIDLATLTGAARIALGVRYAAILGNRQETIDALVAAGTRAGEPLWQLPMPAEYRDSLRSSVADVRKIGVNPDVVARDIVESGNTSAASIPLALSKMIERGEVKSGTPVLLVGFGGGLTYAGQVVRCP
jgi:hypothetical protein